MEYMLINRYTLDVRPVADTVLAILAGGKTVIDYESGSIAWSNELALHAIELKTPSPATKIRSQPFRFDQAGYRREIFDKIAEDIAPHDRSKFPEVDFANARGAIARFDRSSIELRVMDA